MKQAFEQRRLRHLFKTITGATPESQNPEYWNGDVWWVTPEDLGKLEGHEVSSTKRAITQEGLASCATTVAAPGSLVFSKRAPIGQAAILRVEAACNQGCFLLTPNESIDARFYYYALVHHRPELEILGRGSTFMELSTDDLKSFKLPFPPLPTQYRISDYLDAETQRIDELIAAKRSMLALLEKKRAALVSQAVTKGLDPKAEMKDSGLEWLGEIPAHWGVQKLKYVSVVGNGSTPLVDNPLYWQDGDFPWLNSSVVNDRIVKEPSRMVTELALKECHLPKIEPPALLMAITGQGKTRGRTAILEFEATINQHVAYIKPDPSKADCTYLHYLLNGAYDLLRHDSEGTGSTKGAITCEQIGNFRVALPSIDEQREIVAWIATEISSSDELESAIDASITLLVSRRSALITAAVTGQLSI